jgi:hypothetical protein
MNGTKDCQVPADMNLPVLRCLLPRNKRTQIVALEGHNHLFQRCTTGRPDEYYQIEETISEEALTTIIAWLQKL